MMEHKSAAVNMNVSFLHIQEEKLTSEIQYVIWYSFKTKFEAFKHLMKC